MAQALLTAVALGTLGLGATAVFGLLGTDLSRHITIGIFSTMITLLAHSMMMFYLIGKGKAVKDAMAEAGLTGDYFRRIAIARKPVFSIGTVAMAVTSPMGKSAANCSASVRRPSSQTAAGLCRHWRPTITATAPVLARYSAAAAPGRAQRFAGSSSGAGARWGSRVK